MGNRDIPIIIIILVICGGGLFAEIPIIAKLILIVIMAVVLANGFYESRNLNKKDPKPNTKSK
jgi:hypothetical protein